MTTYDDADLFSDAFTDFRGVAPSRRHSRLLTVLALTAAVLVVVGGLVGARLADHDPALPAVAPASLVSALAQSQQAADVIAASDASGLAIDPQTTRLLLSDATGSYYAAAAPGHQLCLVSVPLGDVAQTSCASTQGTQSPLTIDDVMLVPAGATAPAGWHQSGPNVYVKG